MHVRAAYGCGATTRLRHYALLGTRHTGGRRGRGSGMVLRRRAGAASAACAVMSVWALVAEHLLVDEL